MKSFRQFIVEMAKPRSSDVERTYYHGTSKEEAGKSIIKSREIIPPDLKNREGKLRPIEGRVYLTSDLKYSVIYCLGANMIGTDIPDSMIEKDGNYGYLFVIDGKSLIDIQPDEDAVGRMVSDLVNRENIYNYNLDDVQWLEDFAIDILDNIPYESEDYEDEEEEDYGNIFWYDTLLDAVKDRMADDGAQAGKILLDRMSDVQKLDCISAGAAISNKGSIRYSEAWRFDKRKSSQLKKDGSNFFRIAERVV